MLNFNVSKEDSKWIDMIADRAMELTALKKTDYKKIDLLMDITAAHASGCPLELEKLCYAPQFDFAHDVIGIINHLDRETGELKDLFLPCYAKLKGGV